MKRLSICMFLAEPYNPDMPARPAVMEISSKLVDAGNDVTWAMPAELGVKRIRERRHNKVQVFTIPHYSGSLLIGKILAQLLLVVREVRLAKELIVRRGCDIIQAREDIAGGLAALYLARKYRIPFVFQYSFPFVDSVREKHKHTKMNPLFQAVSALGNMILLYIMRRADMVLPVSDQMKDDLARQGIARQKMTTMPLCVNTTLFSSNGCGAARNRTRWRYNLHGLPVVLYVGTLDTLRQPEILVQVMVHLKELRSITKLLVVGGGDGEHHMSQLVRDSGLGEDIIFTGPVPYELVPAFIAAADIGLSPVPPTRLYRSNSPSKMFEYMAMGKPVVANTGVYEHEVSLISSGGGVLVPFKAEDFAVAVADILSKPQWAAEMGQRGREWVVACRSYDTMARRIDAMYHQLMETQK